MDPLVTASLIQAGGALGGAWMQESASKKAAKRQYKYQLDLMNRQNAYNHPAAQMERLKEAGLNPMLVYGNGSVVGNTSATGSAPTVGTADYQAAAKGVAGAISDYFTRKKMNQDVQLGQAQVDQVKANTAAAIMSILRMDADIQKINAETSSALYNLGLAQKRGVRDSSLSTFELGTSYGSKVKDLLRDVVKGHPSGKNSIYDQIRRLFD